MLGGFNWLKEPLNPIQWKYILILVLAVWLCVLPIICAYRNGENGKEKKKKRVVKGSEMEWKRERERYKA